MELSTRYEPQATEAKWYPLWNDAGCFGADANSSRPPYCIVIPPPNITGILHMGHALNNTLQDALIRWRRMAGDNALWVPGTDHAGIATQNVVERSLLAQGSSRHSLGREAFLEQVWQWRDKHGDIIVNQLKRMGCSCDWTRERFTLDEGLTRAVRTTFSRLYRDGLIYRGNYLVNWCVRCGTTLADDEVEYTDKQGKLWHMRYPIEGLPGEFAVVATTRPETMLGDTAVAVNPADDRYKHLIGRHVLLPLVNRRIPIIADDFVDREFGTGMVKITPAHDPNDYQAGKRHGLEEINVLTPDGHINENGAAFEGLERYAARKAVVAELEKLGLMEKIESHPQRVGECYRCHTAVEPYISLQWFVKMAPLAAPARKAVEDGRVHFHPEGRVNDYYRWLDGLRDWAISRQLWWGHQIPAFYDDEGNVHVPDTDEEYEQMRADARDGKLRQDPDVLDTWFSSALWPFSTLGWPDEQSADLKAFYPTSVLITAKDIIFFWVARMIMMGLKFMDDVPFREVYIHGLVRDAHGQKMSKSKGNVLDPIDLIDGIDLEPLVTKRTSGLMQPEMAKKIEKQTRAEFPDGIKPYGTDALRFTFAALASTGRDINFDTGRIEGYRNFCNKLWNAARYVLMNTEDKDCGQSGGACELSLADRWILSRLQRTVATVNEAVAGYRFDLAAQAIYDFTWNEYCDWYLELSKPVLTSGEASEAQERGTRQTLVRALETLLRLAHPIMPYITEEIWQRVAPLAGVTGATVMRQPYPQAGDIALDAAAEVEMQWVMDFIVGVRKIRSGMNIAPSKALPVLLHNGSAEDQARLERNALFLQRLARTESITWLNAGDNAPESATSLVGEMQLLVPMAGLIDKEAELARLAKEMGKLEKDIERVQAKLSNEAFTAKAPAELVEKERTRLAEVQTALAQLGEQQARIARL